MYFEFKLDATQFMQKHNEFSMNSTHGFFFKYYCSILNQFNMRLNVKLKRNTQNF